MKAFDSITHKSIWNALKSCGIEHDYISLLKKLGRDQKATVLTDEESDMLNIKKGTRQGDPLSSLLFNTVLQKALEEYVPRWQKKRGMGIDLSDNDHDCLTNLPTTCSYLHPQKNSSKKCCANSSEVLKKWDSGSIQERRKFSGNRSLNIRKEIEIDDIKVEVLTREDSTKCLGQMITFQQQETTEIRNRISGCLGNVPQRQTGADIEKLHAQTSTSAFRRCGNPDDELRLWNLDTHKRARKNDSIDATQSASTHHTNEKEIQKDRETKRRDQREKRH